MLRNRCAWGCWCISSGLQSVGFSLNYAFPYSSEKVICHNKRKMVQDTGCRCTWSSSWAALCVVFFCLFACFDFVQHLHSWPLARTAIDQIIEDCTTQAAHLAQVRPKSESACVEFACSTVCEFSTDTPASSLPAVNQWLAHCVILAFA